MTLVLNITNVDSLANGSPTTMTLERRGATIGRSPHVDWSLPDPQSYISSSHCDIEFRNGEYWLVDKSTNGTYVNGSPNRPDGPQRLNQGDKLAVGQYIIEVNLGGGGVPTGLSPPAAPQAAPEWGGWDSHGSALPPPSNLANWGAPPARAAITGEGAMSGNWSPPPVSAPPAPPPAAGPTPWDTPAPAATPASDWSSPGQASTSGSDVWSQLADTNVVDWARGGFGSGPDAKLADWDSTSPASSPGGSIDWGAAPPTAPAAPPSAPAPPSSDWGAGLSAPSPGGIAPPQPPATPMPPPAAAQPAAPAATPADSGRAIALLGRMVAGLVVMLEARARAKAQLGAQGTSLSLNGNNPLKFARSAEDALQQLLDEPERGFMPAEEAIEDAFHDLQAHQMATLAAMQGALASTLDRFSPSSIRKRAESKGLLARIMPNAQDAAMWKAYEREFEGVVKGSDEAFMEVFAKEFREAYEKAAAGLKRKG